MQTHVKIGKIQKWRHCIKLHVWLLTQRSGTEEDSPGRLPPSASSSVFYLFSSLHGSQLLTCVIMIHQPNEHTQEELMKDPPPNLLQCRDKSQIIAVCVCVSSTCQRRASGRPHGTPCRRRSSHRTSPLLTPRLFG